MIVESKVESYVPVFCVFPNKGSYKALRGHTPLFF